VTVISITGSHDLDQSLKDCTYGSIDYRISACCNKRARSTLLPTEPSTSLSVPYLIQIFEEKQVIPYSVKSRCIEDYIRDSIHPKQLKI